MSKQRLRYRQLCRGDTYATAKGRWVTIVTDPHIDGLYLRFHVEIGGRTYPSAVDIERLDDVVSVRSRAT